MSNGVYLGSFTGGTTAGYLGTNNYFNGSNFIYKNSDFATRYQQVDGKHQWYNAPSGTAGNAISFTQAMTLDASGNVGIGTSSPNSPLEVSNGTENHRVAFGTGEVYLMARNASSYITQEYIANQHVFTGYGDNSSNEAMRLDASGNLLVGKTATNYQTVGVEAKGNGSLWATADGNGPLVVTRKTSDGTLADFYKDTTKVGSIGTTSGDLTIDGPSEHTGLRFEATDITPRHNGALSNGVNDLGTSSPRLKDPTSLVLPTQPTSTPPQTLLSRLT